MGWGPKAQDGSCKETRCLLETPRTAHLAGESILLFESSTSGPAVSNTIAEEDGGDMTQAD